MVRLVDKYKAEVRKFIEAQDRALDGGERYSSPIGRRLPSNKPMSWNPLRNLVPKSALELVNQLAGAGEYKGLSPANSLVPEKLRQTFRKYDCLPQTGG